MTAEEYIHDRYPHAVSIHRASTGALGQPSEWVVHASGDVGASVLGKGNSAGEAWTNAAELVRARRAKKFPSFKEWLAEEEERGRTRTQRAKLIEDWTDSVSDLFAQMIRWLAEDDTGKLFLVETGKLKKDEQGIGFYEVAVIRLSLSSRFVDLIPIGRNIVGGIGKHGDLGFRSEGRVDMTNGVDKFMLYRAITQNGKEWMIVDDEDYEVRSLTKATFEEALQELLS